MKRFKGIVKMNVEGTKADGVSALYHTKDGSFFVENGEIIVWHTENRTPFFVFEDVRDYGKMWGIKYFGKWRFFDKDTHQVIIWETKTQGQLCTCEDISPMGEKVQIMHYKQWRVFSKDTHKEI